MISYAILGKVISTDTLGTVAGADHVFAGGVAFGAPLLLVVIVQTTAQNPPGLGAVLVLAFLVLHADGNAGRYVFQFDGGTNLVYVLPAGTAGAGDVLDDFIFLDIDVADIRP